MRVKTRKGINRMKKTKQLSPFFQIRAKKAEERFNKTHDLKKMGLKVSEIRKVLKMSGDKTPSISTIQGYLLRTTYAEYSAYHKNRIATAKAKRKAKVEVVAPAKDVEVKRTLVTQEKIDLNRANLSKVEDLIAEAYEQLKLIKWGLK